MKTLKIELTLNEVSSLLRILRQTDEEHHSAASESALKKLQSASNAGGGKAPLGHITDLPVEHIIGEKQPLP